MLHAGAEGVRRPRTATGGAAAALLDAMPHSACSLIFLTDGTTSSHAVFQVTVILSLVTVQGVGKH